MQSLNEELAVKFSRRSLIFALALLLLIGAGAGLSLFHGSMAAAGERLPTSLPVVIAIGIAALMAMRRPTRADLDAVQRDELRQHSLARAYRTGFFAMLIAQSGLAVLAGRTPFPASFMACMTLVVGGVAMLATLLWLDR